MISILLANEALTYISNIQNDLINIIKDNCTRYEKISQGSSNHVIFLDDPGLDIKKSDPYMKYKELHNGIKHLYTIKKIKSCSFNYDSCVKELSIKSNGKCFLR